MNKLILAAILALCTLPVIVGVVSYAQEQPAVVESTPETTAVVDETGTSVVTTENVTTVSAPDATTVVVPVGSWVDKVLAAVQTAVGSIVAIIIAWAFRALPKSIVDFLHTLQVEQILARGVDYALSATRGAAKDLKLDVNVGNAAVARALQYVVDSAPGWFWDFAGGEQGIREKIVARLPLSEDVDAADLGVR